MMNKLLSKMRYSEVLMPTPAWPVLPARPLSCCFKGRLGSANKGNFESGQHKSIVSRVSDQNGVSLLYIMLEMHHSGREPSVCSYIEGSQPEWYISTITMLEMHHSFREPSVCSYILKDKECTPVFVTLNTPPRWPSGKASASGAEDPGFEPRLRRDFFRGRIIPVTPKLALQWLPCQAPGVIGSALGLVGPVSVYCDWVRWKVGSAASISVWQHVKLSEQIRP